eukprot:430847-Pelagomonas_calceolata.AAC.1
MSEQDGEQQQQQQQQRPPPPRRDFQLSFHHFLKRELEDPKVAGACALEGGSEERRVARRVEKGDASTDEDSNESEEGVGSSEKDGSERGVGGAAVSRRARRGVAKQRVEGSRRTWITILG